MATRKVHFQVALDGLHDRLVGIGGLAEEFIDLAVRCSCARQNALSSEVLSLFAELREWENQVNEIVFQLLLRRQLGAADIRHLLDCIKINSTLGRISTLALNSADLGLSFLGTWSDLPNYIPKLGLTASGHLHRALQAFSDADEDLAASLMEDVDIVVLMGNEAWIHLVEKMKSCPETTDQALRAVMIVRNLEGITEHAKGIAQCVLSSSHRTEGRGDDFTLEDLLFS